MIDFPDLTDQINHDELNCPACADQSMMKSAICSTDEIKRGVQLTCPTCGFYLGGINPAQVESAVRTLWAYMPEVDERDEEAPQSEEVSG